MNPAVKSRDTSNLPWIGPVPRDIAEVEAYCRIFRSAERLHRALIETLCNSVIGECRAPYNFSPEEKPLLEDKIVSVLGKKLILLGRSTSMSSFSLDDVGVAEDTLPQLVVFRGEMKRCCKSLHIALKNYLTPDNERSGIEGKVTEEGLKWFIEKGFKTIVDLRAETVKDTFFQAALDDAISTRKITLVKILIEVRMAPLAQQVELFASVVSDTSKRPIYVHSNEGVWRTSAMVSWWKQYMTHPVTKEIPVSEEAKRQEVSETKVGLKVDKNVPDQRTDKVSEINEIDNGSASNQSKESGSDQQDAPAFNMVSDPLKAQVPPGNIFSRKEMSKFLRNKGIAPAGYLSNQSKKLGIVPSPQVSYTGVTSGFQIADSVLTMGSFQMEMCMLLIITNTSVSDTRGNGFSAEPIAVRPSDNRSVVYQPVRDSERNSSASSSDSSDDESGAIEGNMCASSRVQSRKKAEMFFVRTDGVSCTREKVTES
ncbi:hypothetical protein Bca52824_027250 [Brassica carinata]|uniref:DSP-PTPase phosphatase fused to NAD+ Kinase domain-containing protein n=1 Tax=Brassica carinata TaxID=52824 RepID=A0A8X7V9N1_BRACI|nr:hypothetical protein Bca52824_027250 [Brassica carinata]